MTADDEGALQNQSAGFPVGSMSGLLWSRAPVPTAAHV